jgi:hypothetical protein
MSKDETTKISADGLRYKSKEGGSPFGASASIASIELLQMWLAQASGSGYLQARYQSIHVHVR